MRPATAGRGGLVEATARNCWSEPPHHEQSFGGHPIPPVHMVMTAGPVVVVGPAASGVARGSIVGAQSMGCGSRWECANGRENARPRTSRSSRRAGARREWGSWNYLGLPARTSCRTRTRSGDVVPPHRCSPSPRTHAVKLSLEQLRPGSSALVIVLEAGTRRSDSKAILSTVLAVDVRRPALQLARQAGADARSP